MGGEDVPARDVDDRRHQERLEIHERHGQAGSPYAGDGQQAAAPRQQANRPEGPWTDFAQDDLHGRPAQTPKQAEQGQQ